MVTNGKKAFFFDRDGVLNNSIKINGKPFSPRNLEEFKINSEANVLVNYLRARNYLIIVVTNQPDVRRKKISKEFVEKIHKVLRKQLKIDDIMVCYDDRDTSPYRKPKPGMIFQAKKKWNINLKKSFLVGDRSKDILAGLTAGVKTIFIYHNYSEKKPIFSNYKIKKLSEIKNFV